MLIFLFFLHFVNPCFASNRWERIIGEPMHDEIAMKEIFLQFLFSRGLASIFYMKKSYLAEKNSK